MRRWVSMRCAEAIAFTQLAPRYGVEIRPLLVATIKRLPQPKMPTTWPTPGTVSPRFTLQIPSGPSNTAVPLTTSRSTHPSMVVGRVSGTEVRGASTVGVAALAAGETVVGGAGGS